MTLRALFLLALLSLVCTPLAAAEGPVFVVIPNSSLGSSDSPASPLVGSAADAQAKLRAARYALKRTRATQEQAVASSARIDLTSESLPLLSDRLDAERQSAQLLQSADNAASRADRLEQQIEALQLQLQPQPVAIWPLDPTSAVAGPVSLGAEAVSIAEQYLGIPYRWGAADPLEGFDCSGLTMYVYAKLGIPLRHYAADQWNDLPHVDASQLEPGDLVFFEPGWDGPGHVGIFAGGDSFIEAPHSGDVVKIASLSQEAAALGFVGAARPMPTFSEEFRSSS
jgi:cell wall-associated NlpC family hydrolase